MNVTSFLTLVAVVLLVDLVRMEENLCEDGEGCRIENDIDPSEVFPDDFENDEGKQNTAVIAAQNDKDSVTIVPGISSRLFLQREWKEGLVDFLEDSTLMNGLIWLRNEGEEIVYVREVVCALYYADRAFHYALISFPVQSFEPHRELYSGNEMTITYPMQITDGWAPATVDARCYSLYRESNASIVKPRGTKTERFRLPVVYRTTGEVCLEDICRLVFLLLGGLVVLALLYHFSRSLQKNAANRSVISSYKPKKFTEDESLLSPEISCEFDPEWIPPEVFQFQKNLQEQKTRVDLMLANRK